MKHALLFFLILCGSLLSSKEVDGVQYYAEKISMFEANVKVGTGTTCDTAISPSRVGTITLQNRVYLDTVYGTGPVTTISPYAFYNCTGITGVILPDTLTTIKEEAFLGCTGLITIKIPKSVTAISETSFKGCSSLKITVDEENRTFSAEDGVLFNKGKTTLLEAPGVKGNYVVLQGVRGISSEAFAGVVGLNAISFPESLSYISAKAFSGCTSLKAIYFNGDPPSSTKTDSFQNVHPDCIGYYPIARKEAWAPVLDTKAVWKETGITMVPYDETDLPPELLFSYTITDSKVFITGLLKGTSPKTIAIPTELNGLPVVAIGENAFRGSTSLISVLIPETVTVIGEGAFADCTELKELTLKGAYRFDEAIQQFETVYFEQAYKEDWRTAFLAHSSGTKPSKWICLETGIELGSGEERVVIEMFPANCGELSFTEKVATIGKPVSVTATAKVGYTFLGWESNADGIGGTSTTLTFIMLDQPVELKAYFAATTPLNAWKNNQVQEAIDEKLTSGDLLTKGMAKKQTDDAIQEKLDNKELVSADAIKEMALGVPMIEVVDGKAKVGIDLQRATNLSSGTWEKIKGEEASIAEDGTLQVKVPADEKAAFYKFVVPVKQK